MTRKKAVMLTHRRPTWEYTVRVLNGDHYVGITFRRPQQYPNVSTMYNRDNIPKWMREAMAILDVARDGSGQATVPEFGTVTGATYVIYPLECEGEANENTAPAKI